MLWFKYSSWVEYKIYTCTQFFLVHILSVFCSKEQLNFCICWIPWIVTFSLCILPSIPWPLDYCKVFPLSHEVWVNEVWLFLFLCRYCVVHWPCMQTTCCVSTFVEQHAMRASGSWGQRSVIDKNQVFHITLLLLFNIFLTNCNSMLGRFMFPTNDKV